jgi:hypothetical protein
MELRPKYPHLSQFAIDILTIPASSCDCERLFSELGDLLKPRRRGIGSELLASLQLLRSWTRAGYTVDYKRYNMSEDEGSDDAIAEEFGIQDWIISTP